MVDDEPQLRKEALWEKKNPRAVMSILLLAVLVVFQMTHFHYHHQLVPLLEHPEFQPRVVVPNATTPQYSSRTQPHCFTHRGQRGHWYINTTMAQETFYVYGYRATQWYLAQPKPKNESSDVVAAVYPGNMYAWQDDSSMEEDPTSSSRDGGSSHCAPIAPIHKDKFCRILQSMNIRRILMIGDSLTINQVESLLGLLGYRPGQFVKLSRKAIITKDTIDCSDDFRVRIQFRRENLGPNRVLTNLTGREDAFLLEHRQQFGPEIIDCVDGGGKMVEYTQFMVNEYCPWHMLYNSSTERTLLVLNQGAHFHSTRTFTQSMDKFVSLFNSIAHPNDIVIYRATVPGHKDCTGENTISPTNMTHDLFLERYATDNYDWNLFDEYNRIAQAKLSELDSSIITHYLNVYNMTVLRPDGHISGTDCLHYMPVGPIDFWNHFLFTNLEDLAKLEEST